MLLDMLNDLAEGVGRKKKHWVAQMMKPAESSDNPLQMPHGVALVAVNKPCTSQSVQFQ